MRYGSKESIFIYLLDRVYHARGQSIKYTVDIL